jgi:tetrahydromethanopterin S-methyltransferase subunit D
MKFKKDEADLDTAAERGTLIASGLVAGDALTGILIGIFAALNIQIDFLSGIITNDAMRNLLSLGIFVVLGGWLYRYSCNIRENSERI